MFGWIIPAPFAKPRILAPPASALAHFGNVSVVMIARANRSGSPPLSDFTSSGIALEILSIGKARPMTPVDETITSAGRHPRTDATSEADLCAAAKPSAPVDALAFPEFT